MRLRGREVRDRLSRILGLARPFRCQPSRPWLRLRDASFCARLRFVEPRDAFGSLQDAKSAAPRTHVRRIGATLGATAGIGMVVPGPECGIVDLEPHVPANASAGRLASGKFAGLSPARGPLHVEPRSEKRPLAARSSYLATVASSAKAAVDS